MQYVIRPGHAGDQLITDQHEAELLPLFQSEWERLNQQSTTFVDVGAHVGHWTVRAALAGVRVVAIEPQPSVLEALRENLRCNRVHDLVDVLPFAAWDRATTLNLDLPTPEETTGQENIYGGNPQNLSGSVAVVNRPSAMYITAYTVDHMLLNYAPAVPGFVKIDVEGSEAHVLRGMEMILRSYRPRLLIEMHDCYYGPQLADEVISLVKAADYHWTAVRWHGSVNWYLRATPAQG